MNIHGHHESNVAVLAPERSQSHACPPHAWGCPVVMKVDPRSVAWTCAHCAAIMMIPVGESPTVDH